jgi:hypothetical protein
MEKERHHRDMNKREYRDRYKEIETRTWRLKINEQEKTEVGEVETYTGR